MHLEQTFCNLKDQSAKNQLDKIQTTFCHDLQAVDAVITHHLQSRVGLITDIIADLPMKSGKRLRALLVLLSARLFGSLDTQHHLVSAIIELMHTASLLHDDVIDGATHRRGKPATHIRFGNTASILVGDFIYSRTFQMMLLLNDLRVMETLSHTTNAITEGEMLQLSYVRNPEVSESQYLQMIDCKTAQLFAASSRLGATLSMANTEQCAQLAMYGYHLGMAFQLMDDVLDFVGDDAQLGKPHGMDVLEGKPTLPMIYALSQANSSDARVLQGAIQGELQDMSLIMPIIHKTNALNYVRDKAMQEAQAALAVMLDQQDNPYYSYLQDLSVFVTQRVS